jgi:uncharacterized membrane-anchored protein
MSPPNSKMIMTTHKRILVTAITTLLLVSPLAAQDSPGKKANALEGPATAMLGNIAQIELPAGYKFFDGKTTRAIMKSSGEPTSGNELGLLHPTNAQWSVIFEFNDVGFVKDDEQDKLDPVKLLAAIKAGNDEGNKQRERNGNPPLLIVGWEQEPKYDPVTHNLTWAIRATSEGRAILNYNTRLLGRKGVMEAVLICKPEEFAKTLPDFNSLIANHKFQSGESYAEYKPGDRIAKYGLGALILGGGAVAAAKLGLLGPLILFFKKAWKLVVVAIVAVASFFKRILNKITGNRPEA